MERNIGLKYGTKSECVWYIIIIKLFTNVLTLQLQIAFDNAYRPIGSMPLFFGLISVSYEISLYIKCYV